MEGQKYPKAVEHLESWKCGNHLVQDPYLYMQNAKDPQVLSWVAEENAYTDHWFEDKNLGQRIQQLKFQQKKPTYHNLCQVGEKLYAVCSGTDGSSAAVEMKSDFSEQKVLLNREMMGGTMNIYGVSPCPADPKIAAFFALKDKAARMSVVIRDLEQNRTLAELDGTFSYTWSSDGAYIYSNQSEQRADGTTENSVVRWNRCTGQQEIVYTWPGHSVFLRLAAGPEGSIFVHVCKDYHDVVMIYLNAQGQAARVMQEENSKLDYLGTIGNCHYFLTDYQAPLGRVIGVEQNGMEFSPMKEVVPEGSFPLEGAGVAGDRLLVIELQDAACALQLFEKDGTFVRTIELPDEIGSVAFQSAAWDSKVRYLEFQSFGCPPSILRYDVESEQITPVYSVQDKPSVEVEVQRRFVTARDGQRILAFLVYPKGKQPDQQTPTLMYGYGGYSASQLPWYNNPFVGMDIPDWLEKGGLYVHCILRGGEEYGAKWHEAGCGLNKKNVFYDFIDIAKAVIADGWTTSEHIAICGGSNGGLLTTALLTMEPSMWRCVIASVPHTDMLHFCCDDRGPMYVTEYGDPREEEFFEYMKSYSPYHNIHQGVAYPFVYVQTGEQDNNVPPYHGKKFAAALQQATTGETVLLRVLPYGSHDRGAGEYFYKTCAEMHLFIEYALGMTGQVQK